MWGGTAQLGWEWGQDHTGRGSSGSWLGLAMAAAVGWAWAVTTGPHVGPALPVTKRETFWNHPREGLCFQDVFTCSGVFSKGHTANSWEDNRTACGDTGRMSPPDMTILEPNSANLDEFSKTLVYSTPPQQTTKIYSLPNSNPLQVALSRYFFKHHLWITNKYHHLPTCRVENG